MKLRPVEPPFRSLFLEHGTYSARNRADVERLDEKSKAATVQCIDRSVAVAANDRRSTPHRLQKHNPESLPGTRHREYVGKPVVVHERVGGYESSEADRRIDSLLPGESFNSRLIFARAHYEKSHGAAFPLNGRERFDDPVVALVPLAVIEARNSENDFFVRLYAVFLAQADGSFANPKSLRVDRVRKKGHVSRLDSAKIKNTTPRPCAHRDNAVGISKRRERPECQALMNVDAVRDECERRSEKTFRESRRRAKIHVRADHVIGAVSGYRSEGRHHESGCLDRSAELKSARQPLAWPASAAVRLSKKPHVMAKIAERERQLAAERGNAATEVRKRRRPQVDFQVTWSSVRGATATRWRATGLGQRSHDHRQP